MCFSFSFGLKQIEIWKNTINQILDIDPKHIKLNSKFNSKNDLEIPESINSNLTIMNYLLKILCGMPFFPICPFLYNCRINFLN